MSFEDAVASQIYQQNQDKSYVDKILAKSEIERTKELQRKENLTRSELLELMYSCLESEAKLVNYSEYDRYIILKYFVWVREFIKIAETVYDIKEDLDNKEKLGIYKLKDRTKEIIIKCMRLIEHIAKFLIDIYLNIARTTLSLGATAFTEINRNKFDFSYPQTPGINPAMNEKKGLFGWMKA